MKQELVFSLREFFPKVHLKLRDDIKKMLIVCSHERSGTHFLMNSIGYNSPYIALQRLDFDLIPLGSFINFFRKDHVAKFLGTFDKVQHEGKHFYPANIIKSHHLPSTFELIFKKNPPFFFYIHRNPIDSLFSFWKYFHRWNWNEGLKAKTPLEFASAPPSGRILRYQTHQVDSHFIRWAEHVEAWIQASQKYDCIKCVQYENLKDNFNEELKSILDFAGLPSNKTFITPKKDLHVIQGVEKACSEEDYKAFVQYCKDQLRLYPSLQALYEDVLPAT